MKPDEEALHLIVRLKLAGARLGEQTIRSPFKNEEFPADLVVRHYSGRLADLLEAGDLADPELGGACRAARQWLARMEPARKDPANPG